MAIVIASSDADDMSDASMPLQPSSADICAWGKRYIIDAMHERKKVAYSTAINYTLEWMGLDGAPLLRAVWRAVEPEEGPQFRASFRAIFGYSFLDLVDQWEESEDESLSASTTLTDPRWML